MKTFLDLLFRDDHTNLPWLKANTILLTLHGSQAYGLATEESDYDYKGIAVAPRSNYLGLGQAFEQAQGKTPSLNAEYVVFEVRKFMSLAADCNPNVLEVLYTDDSDLVHITEAGKLLRDHRDLFLSQRALHTFSGYAVSQLKRIKGHRAWLLNPPTHKPTREEYGLPERTVIPADQLQAAMAAIEKKLAAWNIPSLDGLPESDRIALVSAWGQMLAEMKMGQKEQFQAAGRMLGYSDNFMAILEAERRYKAAKSEWDRYQTWRASRNEKRAALEAKFGYDSKHAMHLVRLLRMCGEILDGKGVIVKRNDRDELLAVRNGEWAYDDLVAWADAKDKEVREKVKTTKLPHSPDREKLSALCERIIDMVSAPPNSSPAKIEIKPKTGTFEPTLVPFPWNSPWSSQPPDDNPWNVRPRPLKVISMDRSVTDNISGDGQIV